MIPSEIGKKWNFWNFRERWNGMSEGVTFDKGSFQIKSKGIFVTMAKKSHCFWLPRINIFQDN